MNRSLPVITESPETLLNLFRREAKPRLQERFRALCLLSSRQVKTRSALARVPGRRRKTLGHRLSLHEAGRAGRLLEFRTHSNRKPCLGPEALARLKERLASPEGFGCHGEVREWIRDTLGKELKSVTVHSLVRYRLQAKLKVARKSPVKKDETLPARFKKTSPASSASTSAGATPPRPASSSRTRAALDCTPWNADASLPRASSPAPGFQMAFQSHCLFGAVEPLSGEDFLLELPCLNAETFQVFLEAFHEKHPDTTNVMILDRAACHMAKKLVIPESLLLIYLPPYSPELNPVERHWKHLKDQIAWRTFGNLKQLKDQVAQLICCTSQDTVKGLTQFPFFMDALISSGLIPRSLLRFLAPQANSFAKLFQKRHRIPRCSAAG